MTNSTSELSQSVTRSPETTSVSAVNGLLDNMEHRLLSLKRKAEESLEEEMESTRLCKVRLDHLKEYVSGKAMNLVWRIELVKGHAHIETWGYDRIMCM